MSVEVGPSGFIAQYETLQTDNYIFIASIIPLVYDYIITFDREVGLFWARSLTGASALFFAARYIPMLYVIFNLVKWYPSIPLERYQYPLTSSSLPTPTDVGFAKPRCSCDLLVKTSLTIDNLQSIAPAVFSGLRAFALTKNRALSLFIFVLFLAPFCVNMFQYHLGITGVNIPGFGCGETYPMTEAEVIIVTAVSRGGSIISDFLLVMVTWWNLKTSPSFARFVRGPRTSLVHVMLWNGSLYFIILFVLNVLHLSLTLSSVLGVRSGATTAEFTNPYVFILIPIPILTHTLPPATSRSVLGLSPFIPSLQ
ncbi:hypothetical protein L227DRAFT_657331 [Lentinus tigrinus ALCF2SS1-6]|uniref:DUF6533 domain-containing protein n=1 Tax=Lentinus tigrinus ALCF2SS1-6 TaxID=1328759 RepID=A0A5C2RUC7_9APHY|nr:hypothetical protein L227DRAFT_657331 [Lentinus tigrinus ALCF2SS1-6]